MKRFGLLLLLCLLAFQLWKGGLAQPIPSTPVRLTLVTGDKGTEGNLRFSLYGSFRGEPFAVILNARDDLQPGRTDTYEYNIPYDFCEVFAWSLELAPGTTDEWVGAEFYLSIDGEEVYFNRDFASGSAISTTMTRSGTWDATTAYRARCPVRPVVMTFVTIGSGTSSALDFALTGDFSASPYPLRLLREEAYGPATTGSYSFIVPIPFCSITGWRLNERVAAPGTPGMLGVLLIEIDGIAVWFDEVHYTPVEGASIVTAAGDWRDRPSYREACGLVASPTPFVMPDPVITPPPVIPDTGITIPTPIFTLPAETPTSTPANALILTATALAGSPAATPAAPAASISPPGAAVICPGFLPSRLTPGGQGRARPGDPNRMRTGPSTQNPVVGFIPGGAPFQVINGPVCDPAGIAWWQVDYNGLIGWTAEGQRDRYFVDPINP
jgi:hypothetical protein